VSGLAHEAHGATAVAIVAPLLAIAIVAGGYVVLAARQHGQALRWQARRTALFLAGCTVLAFALAPGLLPYPAGDFRGHMLQHLLIGMVAPTCLALGAPMSLVLRSVPVDRRHLAGAVLRSRAIHFLTRPAVVLTLNLGGLLALYATPLASVVNDYPAVHHLVHLHFLVSGYLFAWLIAGPDPAPRRPGVPARLVLLGVAIAAHSGLSQLMYAGVLGGADVPAAELRGAATLMYYGGDIAELALAFALVATWRPGRRAVSGPARTG
jgi:putative membrane protein